MNSHNIVEALAYCEPIGCAAVLCFMYYRRQFSQYRMLALFLATKILAFVTLMPILRLGTHSLSRTAAYNLYFCGYWLTYAIEAILGFLIIYSIYNLAMEPLPGLQRLGMLMFRWATAIAVAIALAMAFGPHISAKDFVSDAVRQLQQTQSVLTLCMLLFVCMAIRPMGLSFRSKVFGVSVGLGILAAADLITSAWLSHVKSLYSLLNEVNGIAVAATMVIWIAYFAIPEPKRRMIVLPTTSPFLRWNQISLALGDEPGYVALGPVTPDMFAPAEVEVMRRASGKMGPGPN